MVDFDVNLGDIGQEADLQGIHIVDQQLSLRERIASAIDRHASAEFNEALLGLVRFLGSAISWSYLIRHQDARKVSNALNIWASLGLLEERLYPYLHSINADVSISIGVVFDAWRTVRSSPRAPAALRPNQRGRRIFLINASGAYNGSVGPRQPVSETDLVDDASMGSFWTALADFFDGVLVHAQKVRIRATWCGLLMQFAFAAGTCP